VVGRSVLGAVIGVVLVTAQCATVSRDPVTCEGVEIRSDGLTLREAEAYCRHDSPGPIVVTDEIEIVAYDPRWPQRFALEAARVRSLLGDPIRGGRRDEG
jgi:hypothetical protein